jgi:tetratricopeptide (TPR) repeat protein
VALAAAAPAALPVSARTLAIAAVLCAGMSLGAQSRAAAFADARPAPVEVLPLHSSSADEWRDAADELYGARRDREAIAAYERALQLGVRAPHRAALQVARAYARIGNRKQALRWIERSVELGLADRSVVLEAPELARYRADARFRLIVDRLRAAPPGATAE